MINSNSGFYPLLNALGVFVFSILTIPVVALKGFVRNLVLYVLHMLCHYISMNRLSKNMAETLVLFKPEQLSYLKHNVRIFICQ